MNSEEMKDILKQTEGMSLCDISQLCIQILSRAWVYKFIEKIDMDNKEWFDGWLKQITDEVSHNRKIGKITRKGKKMEIEADNSVQETIGNIVDMLEKYSFDTQINILIPMIFCHFMYEYLKDEYKPLEIKKKQYDTFKKLISDRLDNSFSRFLEEENDENTN